MKWKEWLCRALPWGVILFATVILAHMADLQTVCARFQEAPSRQTLPPAGLWLIVTGACAAGLATAFPVGLIRRFATGAGTLAVAAILGLLPSGLLSVTFLVPVLLLMYLARQHVREQPVRAGLLAGALLTLVLSFAAWQRYTVLLQALLSPIDPDASGYIAIAEKYRGWATHYREPLYIWVLQAGRMFGATLDPVFLRLTGVLTSLLSIALIFGFCWRWIGRTAATVAAVLYAWAPFMVYTAVRGLREDTVIATTFLFIAACLNVWGKVPSLRGYIALGFAGAAAALLRLSSLNFVVVLTAATFAYAVWKHRPGRKSLACVLAPAGIIVLLVTPYLVHCKTQYSDPFYAVNKDIRFYANVELGGTHPDMPSREAIAADGYAGPRITAGEYLFGYHSVAQLAAGSFEGIRRLYFGDFLRAAYVAGEDGKVPGVLFLVHVLGLAAMFFPGRRLTFAAMVLFHAPMFYLISFKWFDPRLLTVAFVGFYVGIGAAATTLVAVFRKMNSGHEKADGVSAVSAEGFGQARNRSARKQRVNA